MKKNKSQVRLSNVAKFSKWISHNGRSLDEDDAGKWFCLHVHTGFEPLIASDLFRKKIPFFVPLLLDREKASLTALWPGYVFYRGPFSVAKKLPAKNRVLKTLLPPDQKRFLAHVRQFSAINSIGYLYSKGEVVEVADKRLEGTIASIADVRDEGRSLLLNIDLLGKRVDFEVSASQVHLPSDQQSRIQVVSADHEIVITPEPEEVLEGEAVRKALDIEFSLINRELAQYLAKHPKLLYQMSPSRFEELVAEILRDMGYEVQLTPKGGDGGRDVLAVLKVPLGEILTIVECKRYKPENKIGIDIVERFLWVMERKDKASCGLIATTSFFSQQALKAAQDYRWRLKLQDFNAMQDWLSNYGNWKSSKDSGLWLPNTNLSSVVPRGQLSWRSDG